MEKIVEIIRRQQPSTEGGLTISKPSPQPSVPEWGKLLAVIAQDKRHDLPMQTIELWKEKLKKYADAEICEALRMYSGQYFPSVDFVVAEIQRIRIAEAEQKQSLYWVDYERNNRDIEKFKAEHGGKTPQQVWCEENREELEKIGRPNVG